MLKEPVDFSLVLGGPLYQLWRGTRLAGDTLQLLHRRVLAMVVVTWVPLVLLSIAEGHAWGATVAMPLSLRHRDARPLPAGAAAAHHGRADRAPADAARWWGNSWTGG